jgi:hypothetical protein
MTTPPRRISVVDPVGQALDRVKLILFQPFDLGKWFTIGFCAWLAFLGESGGGHGGFNFHVPSGSSHRGGSARHELERALEFVMSNLYWILPVVLGVVALLLALWVAFTWLSSRGRFMFLHCVARNEAVVVEPWNAFGREANSLFLFRIVLGLISIVLTLPPVVFGAVLAWRMFVVRRPSVGGVLGLVALGLGVVLVSLVFLLIEKLTKDFVVPLMYLRRRRCRECWGELLGLLRTHAGEFILWLLFQIVLSLVISALVLAAILVTCCIACCLLMLPFLWAVLLLPILVFERSYSIQFLAQFGPDFDVVAPLGPPIAEAAPPAA